jgi:hypothetical protein
LLGTAACFITLPLAFRLHGARSVLLPAGLLTTMGLCQGALIPGEAAIHQSWLPQSVWRPFVLQIMFLCHCATNFVATFTTPRIAERAGSWTAVCYVYGTATAACAVLWQLLVPNRKPRSPQPEPDGGGGGGGIEEKKAAVEWRILRQPAALSVCLCQVADNNLFDSIYLWAPTYFVSELSVRPTAVAAYLAMPQLLNTFGGFAVAALEALLLQAGMDKLRLRKLSTVLGSLIEAIAVVWYARARSAERAAAALCAQTLGQLCHRAGFEQSYHEVGGPDAAILSSVGNAVSNGAGIWVPPCSLLLRRATGSWLPHLALGGGLKLLTAAIYAWHVGLRPAREQLAAVTTSKQANGA